MAKSHKKPSPASATPLPSDKKLLLKVACGALARKVNLPQFSGPEWHHEVVDLTFLSGGPNLNLLKKKSGFDSAFLPYTLQAMPVTDALETLSLVRTALKPGAAVNIMVFDLQKLGESLAVNRQEEAVLKSTLGEFTPMDMIYGPSAPEIRTPFFNIFNALTIGRLLKQANFGQIRVRRDQYNLLAAGVRLADNVSLASERIQVIDSNAPRGLPDDLEVPPQQWQPLGLKR